MLERYADIELVVFNAIEGKLCTYIELETVYNYGDLIRFNRYLDLKKRLEDVSKNSQ